MTAYLKLTPPISVGEAIARYGPAAVSFQAKDDPEMFLITHVAEDHSWTLDGIAPSWLARHTDWRMVYDEQLQRSRLMFRCPVCATLVEHYAEHDPAVKHKR